MHVLEKFCRTDDDLKWTPPRMDMAKHTIPLTNDEERSDLRLQYVTYNGKRKSEIKKRDDNARKVIMEKIMKGHQFKDAEGELFEVDSGCEEFYASSSPS